MNNESRPTRITVNDPRYKEILAEMIAKGIPLPDQVIEVIAKGMTSQSKPTTEERRDKNG